MTMKKQIFLMAALLCGVYAQAQTMVNMEQLFNVQDKYIDLNDAKTVKDGVVFVGDTRTPDKIVDGKYKGMRVQKQRRYFKVGGKHIQYANALSFRRAPQGATKNHQVDVSLVPRSCMLQMKPLSDGKLTFCAQTNKVEGNKVYIAVRNDDIFKVIATLNYQKDEAVTGRKDAPFATQEVDYRYSEGDELWIYTDGSINLFALSFTGNIDKTFTGDDPVAVAKQVRRSMKK